MLLTVRFTALRLIGLSHIGWHFPLYEPTDLKCGRNKTGDCSASITRALKIELHDEFCQGGNRLSQWHDSWFFPSGHKNTCIFIVSHPADR
jgi:hypothetical protein